MPSFVEDCEVVIADAPSRSDCPGNDYRGDDQPAQPGASFPRAARLLKHSDFERVYKQGRRHFSPHMTVFYLVQAANASQQKSARVGFTVGRVLGGAVERNRIKRRLREAVRLSRSTLKRAVDVVINPKKSILTLEFATVLEEVGRAFDAIAKRLAEK
jgi:ribonuclease P protein component